MCLSAERHEDAGDHQVHSSVPAEVLHGKPGEPGSAAQEPQSVPQPWGTFLLHLITFMQQIIQFLDLVQKRTPVSPTGHSVHYTHYRRSVHFYQNVESRPAAALEPRT